ncbi:MAG: winged helix-turn-helix transcriptional regulator [Pseudomonadales bacterium]
MEIGKLILNSSVADALNVLGDRWSLMIVRDVFLGRRRFGELLAHTGTSRGTLSKRLKALVHNGVLYKNPYCAAPARFEYRLTDKGFALYNFSLAIWRWETTWGGANSGELPAKLMHKQCKQQFEPTPLCQHCREPVYVRDVSYKPGPGAGSAPTSNADVLRRSKIKLEQHIGNDSSLFHVTDLIGDRWTPLVLAAAFFGLRRYDDIQKGLNIATNILADRLKLLLDAGVLNRSRYQQNPPRYEYRLTDKGRDLYGVTITLQQWGEQWLPNASGPAVQFYHSCSKKPLRIVMTCSHCGSEVSAQDVVFN